MIILSFIIVYILLQLTTRHNKNKLYKHITINTNVVYCSQKEKQKNSEVAKIKNMILIAASDNVRFKTPKCRVLTDLLNALKNYEDPDEFLSVNPHILNIIFNGGIYNEYHQDKSYQ